MLLLCLGTGVGVTDCHSQCTHWLRNDTGSCMGCGGAGDRKGRPYESVTRGGQGREESPSHGFAVPDPL